jgi:hypothetical protein
MFQHDGRRAPVADLLSSDVGLPSLLATKPILDNYTTFVDATDGSVISDSGFGSVHSLRATTSPTYSESDDTAEVSGSCSEKEEDTTVMGMESSFVILLVHSMFIHLLPKACECISQHLLVNKFS